MPRPASACPSRWDRAGSGRQAACRHRCLDHQRSRCRDVICRSLSARRLPCCARRGARYARSVATLGGQLRRSRGSCGATRPRAVAVWPIVPPRHNGTPSERPDDRKPRSLQPTTDCGPMFRKGSPAWSPRSMAVRSVGPSCRGGSGGMSPGSIAAGPAPGIRSRLPGTFGSTSRMTRPCASATRPFTSRCMCRAEAR